MLSSIDERLGLTKPKRTRKKKQSVYSDDILRGKSSVGDIVYMPSSPEILMTVANIPVCNHAAGRKQMVDVHWLTPTGDFRQESMMARTLIKR